MLLYPAVDKLNEQVPNRYLLVNVVARKAREIADDAESLGEHLSEKPVTLAINGVAAGEVEVDREDLYNALNADERIVVPSAPTMVDIPEEEMEEEEKTGVTGKDTVSLPAAVFGRSSETWNEGGHRWNRSSWRGWPWLLRPI